MGRSTGRGSWLAIQMPGNFETPSHAAVRAVARREPYAKVLRDIPFRVGTVVDTPTHYAELLIGAGCTVDAWETTYMQQLTGEHPVLDWISRHRAATRERTAQRAGIPTVS